jgi:flagellar biosynthesis/type III secretory pathway protein FliH
MEMGTEDEKAMQEGYRARMEEGQRVAVQEVQQMFEEIAARYNTLLERGISVTKDDLMDIVDRWFRQKLEALQRIASL